MLSLALSPATPTMQSRPGGAAPSVLTLITPTTVISPTILIQGS